MSQIKNAQLRYRIIDRALRNQYKPFPSKQNLRQACEEALYGEGIGENICDSTIEKDLFAMRMDHDAPIKYSKIEKGYYYEDDTYSIDNIPLSEGDIDAIKFATKTLMQFKDVDMFKQFGFAIDKIFDRVHISSNPNEQTVADYVQFETVPETLGTEFLPDLLKAIKEKQIVKFNYTSFATEKTKVRKVLPLLLKEYRNRWYLISYNIEKKRVITFGLDRMSSLELTENYHLKDIDFNADMYFKHAIGITSYDTAPEKIEFKIDKLGSKYIMSQPLHSSQTLVKEGKNRNTFRIEVLISEELKRLILSYGSQIEILKPESFRNQIINEAINLHERYS
ncbi:MAG: WYL domain-containing protein [Putridiphycobacter sp.]|jgi:predicted DNA-binding transcriptional regulator YafY|nr:WYL domain-containing protein [Putridiphycobacter sp.]